MPGDIVYTESLGQPMVFLNSLDAARELLDNRSGLYSDRPESPSLNMYVCIASTQCFKLTSVKRNNVT